MNDLLINFNTFYSFEKIFYQSWTEYETTDALADYVTNSKTEIAEQWYDSHETEE